MLSFKLLKNHAGILLIGDYTTLKLLHEVVHDVNERSRLIQNKEGAFIELAFDARKAFERQRKVIRPPAHFEEVGTRYGVQILWPVLLVQARMLRQSLAFFDHGKSHQAIAYALEAIIEEALKAEFKADANVLIQLWNAINPAHPHAEAKLHSRCTIFSTWSKAERQKFFPGLLMSLDPMYDFTYKFRTDRGDTNLVSPEEYQKWEGAELADPHW